MEIDESKKKTLTASASPPVSWPEPTPELPPQPAQTILPVPTLHHFPRLQILSRCFARLGSSIPLSKSRTLERIIATLDGQGYILFTLTTLQQSPVWVSQVKRQYGLVEPLSECSGGKCHLYGAGVQTLHNHHFWSNSPTFKEGSTPANEANLSSPPADLANNMVIFQVSTPGRLQLQQLTLLLNSPHDLAARTVLIAPSIQRSSYMPRMTESLRSPLLRGCRESHRWPHTSMKPQSSSGGIIYLMIVYAESGIDLRLAAWLRQGAGQDNIRASQSLPAHTSTASMDIGSRIMDTSKSADNIISSQR
ncbi:hypothetical protein EV127DRAFT_408553 [Xylaria flabelliformis]|nr:hypothetical protein EV127DRAFT_408553 [Xylaria flabelliformis]